MPPKSKFTKEEIINAAFELIRNKSVQALTARNLANELKSSTAPIFTFFSTIEQIETEVNKKAKKLYSEYVAEGLKMHPSFRGMGLKYIEFAKNEPELFKLIFMSEKNNSFTHSFLPSFDENSPDIMNILINNYKLSENAAKRLYNHMSVYAFGLATLFAQKINIYSFDEITDMFSDLFKSLIFSESDEDAGYLKDMLKKELSKNQ